MPIQLPALMVQDPNIFGRFAQGQQVANQNRMLDLNAQNQEFQQNRATADDQFQREQFTAQQKQIMQQAEGTFYGRVGEMLATTTDPAQRQEIWRNARIVGERIGIPDIQEMDDLDVTDDRNVQGIMAQAEAYGYGRPQGASSKAFAPVPMADESGNFIGYGMPVFDPATGQSSLQPVQAPVGSGFINPATLAGQKSFSSESGKLTAQAGQKPTVEADVMRAKTGAKLDVELQKAPQVAAAIKQAEAQAAAFVNEGQTQKKDAAAYSVYLAGMTGLIAGLGGTETGPIAGRLPAVTTSQQIAEGSVAAMAPILKSMFRVAGEGTFTDKDQELLIDILPTRKDTPDTIASKISNIDAIIRAKLGQTNNQPRGNQPKTSAGSAGNKSLDDEIRRLEEKVGL